MDEVTVIRDFPRRVREIENAWIPMPDGTRLAARIWLPEDAEARPVPAILEYLPYRKRDGTVERDHLTHPYFAGHGYAAVRVDMRGTGDSEGVCRGEYLRQEQDDCLEVLRWIAAQPWSTGHAGMIGISWGGFNGLQVAARRPPELKAVISLCSTDDRYADDIHFMGGCTLADKLGWGGTAFAIAMTPPDPAIVGHRWREMWRQRLEGNGLWLLDWFRHQRCDDFYRHGSICENYADVEIPVYAVGGWADGYTNPIFRMLENLKGPRKGLVGPWGHKYPHFARPGPRIGFLQECLRWWDHWLKGIDTGIMAEPLLRAYMEDSVPPAPYYAHMPGRWVAEPAWPAPGVASRALALGADGTLRDGAPAGELTICSPQTIGMAAATWCCYALDPDGSLDQRAEAGGSLVFETAPLEDDVEILGFPILEAEVASDRPVAHLTAVLSDVAADGAATRVSYGPLNLTHRDSHAKPAPLEPGRFYKVRVQLNACGKRFAKGRRIRLALSTAYWPVIFPAPEVVTLTLRAGASRLVLPVRAAQAADAGLPDFARPESAEPMAQTVLRNGGYTRRATHDHATGEVVLEKLGDGGAATHAHTGITFDSAKTGRFRIMAHDPNSAVASCDWVKDYRRAGWHARVETTASVQARRDAWRLRATLRAYDGDSLFYERDWDEDVPRDLA